MRKNYKTVLSQTKFMLIHFGVVAALCTPIRSEAQADGSSPERPSNPIGSGPVINIAKPIQYGGSPTSIDRWSWDLSASYFFLNDRSRVGGISSDTNSGIIDFTASLNVWSYTSFDLAYMYAGTGGSAPNGTSQNADEHSIGLRILQPLDELWSDGNWKPVTVDPTTPKIHFQSAIIVSGDYGWAFSSLKAPRTTSIDGSADPFLGNILFDFQFAYLWKRGPNRTGYDYPNLLVEGSTGFQFATTRFGPAARVSAVTSVSEQVVYRHVWSITYSPFSMDMPYLLARLGLIGSVELDNPLSVEPNHDSRPFYATTAVFTGGLVYNFYPIRHTTYSEKLCQSITDIFTDPDAWSISLLYSYKAFDPLTEANQLQVQISFAF